MKPTINMRMIGKIVLVEALDHHSLENIKLGKIRKNLTTDEVLKVVGRLIHLNREYMYILSQEVVSEATDISHYHWENNTIHVIVRSAVTACKVLEA